MNDILIKTRVVFITHIHGDHQLGVLKILLERDKLIESDDGQCPIYVVTPSPMMVWMQLFVQDSIKNKTNTKLIVSKNLNPESCYYY